MSASPESFLLHGTCDIATLFCFEHIPLTASSFALLLKLATVFIAVVVVPRVERERLPLLLYLFGFVILVLQLVFLETKPLATYDPCVGLTASRLCRDGAARSRFLPLSVFVSSVGIPLYFSENL